MNRYFLILALVCVGAASPPRPAAEIAILAALDTELDALKKEVELVGRPLNFDGRAVWQARFGGKRLLLAKTGSNPQAAGAMARWLVEERKIDAVVSIGPAGALSDELNVGDVVGVRKAARGQNSEVRIQDLTHMTDCGLKTANTIVTVDRFVASSAERARLREVYNADLVDMSAAAIVAALGERGQPVPCIIIREITDRADEDAPRAFAETVREKQPRTVAAALCALEKMEVHP